MEIAMANASAKVTEINLKVKPQELSMIVDALYENLEDMENANDDFSQVTLNVEGRLPFYKVEKQSDPHVREWFIKYTRLARQLDRMYVKVRKLGGTW
jgi:uncharacterized protein YaaN involved in tellurite resistance